MPGRERKPEISSRALFDSHPLPMWVFDVKTLAFLAVNAAAIRHYGYSRREFLALTIMQIRPEEDVPALLDKIAQLAAGLSLSGIWRHRKKDGTIIDVEIVTHAIRFAGRRARLVLANDVTQRRRLEQALQATADEWRKTFDAMTDAVALMDRDGVIYRCNRAMASFAGKDFSEIIGRSCWEVVHGTADRVDGCPVAEMMATGNRVTATLPVGSRIFRVTADPLLDESGRFIGALHIMSDVTAQEHAEKILHDLVLQQEAILNNVPDIAWLKDDQGRFLAVNEAFGKASGTAPAELIGKTDLDIWPRELAERYRSDDREVMQSGRRKIVEEPLSDKQGKTEWIETIKTPIVDGDGHVIGTTGVARDITARRLTEDALRRKTHLLAEAQRIAHIGSWEVDFATGKISWSDELYRISGVSPETFKPSIHSFISLVYRTDRSAIVLWIKAAIAGERVDELEFRVVRPEGTVRTVRGSIEPIRDAAGALVGAIGTGQDITDRTEAERRLLEQKLFSDTLIQNSSVATFVLDARHEVVIWNRACEELTGLAAAEIVGTRLAWKAFYDGPRLLLADIVLDGDLERLSTLFPGASQSVLVPEWLHAERWIAGLNGRDSFFIFDAAPIRDSAGTVVAAVETLTDLTAQKRAEEAIAESEKRYRDLFDNANDMIQSVAPDGRILYVNASWRRVLGYEAADLGALNLFDIVHPDSRERCRDLLAQVLSGASVGLIEARFVAKDGSLVDVEGSASVRRSGGAVLSAQGIFRDVTERKRLQEEVYRISHDWEETFNTITDMVTVHDKDFNIIRANKAAGKILGLPFLHAQPVKCFKYYHGTGCPPAGCPSCSSLVTGEPSVSEMFEPHLGRTIEIRAIPRLDSAGRVAGLIHVVRDITERTQAEAAKREQMLLAEFGMHIGTALNREDLLRKILSACTEHMVRDLGAAFARIWTVSPDERSLVLQASSGLYTHLDGAHGLIPIESTLKIPTIARTRKPHLTNQVIGDVQVDQEWAEREGMVAFAGYPLQVGTRLVGVMGLFSRRALSDSTLSALEAVANNIASGVERLQSAEALKRYSEELSALSAASNNLLALASLPELHEGICRFAEKVFGVELVWLGLVEAGSSAVTIAGAAGAGREYLRMLKVTLDDSPTGGGPTGLAIRSRQPRLARKDSPEFAPWRAAAETYGFETSLAVPLVSPTKAGTCIGALNFYSRFPDYFTPDRVRLCQIFANQAAIAIENARLIEGLEDKIAARTREYESANVELQRLNQELELRRVEAESASRIKSDFLANMSHELRTPLNAIIGFSSLMTRGMAGTLEQRQKEHLEDILSSGKHLLSLINDILDLSKVEAGKMELEPSEFDFAELIERSLVLFKEKALAHRIEITTDVEEAMKPAFGDARKIRQVLVNLVSNAVKFTPDGGSVTVRARTVRHEGVDFAEIAVSDTGIGISREDQGRLFQPFRQLGHYLTKEYEGTGLGLALCKAIVELHCGRIWLESTPGRGSTLTFRVPLRFEKDASCRS